MSAACYLSQDERIRIADLSRAGANPVLRERIQLLLDAWLSPEQVAWASRCMDVDDLA